MHRILHSLFRFLLLYRSLFTIPFYITLSLFPILSSCSVLSFIFLTFCLSFLFSLFLYRPFILACFLSLALTVTLWNSVCTAQVLKFLTHPALRGQCVYRHSTLSRFRYPTASSRLPRGFRLNQRCGTTRPVLLSKPVTRCTRSIDRCSINTSMTSGETRTWQNDEWQGWSVSESCCKLIIFRLFSCMLRFNIAFLVYYTYVYGTHQPHEAETRWNNV
jgi:hypothetical protein